MSLLHPPSSTATGAGLANCVANIPNTFTVHAKDAFSNDRRGTRTPANLGTGTGSDDAFLVTLVGPGDTRYVTSTAVHHLNLTSNSNDVNSLGGTFTLTYGDRTTEEIPVVGTTAAALDTAIESLYWPNVRSCTVTRVERTDGILFRIVFTSHLNLWHPSTVTVDGTGVTGGSVESEQLDTHAKLGAYPVTYTAWTKGNYSLEITSGGEENIHIHGSPFFLITHDGDVHPETSTATGSGLTGGVAGDPFLFVVQAKDTRAYEEQSIVTDAIRIATVHEVQMFECPGGTGNWALSLAGEPTSTLTSTSSVAAIKAALEALPTVPGTVTVSFSEVATNQFCAANNVMRVTFDSNLDDVQPMLFFDPASPSVTTALTESVKGKAPSRKEVQLFVCDADAGAFKIKFRGAESSVGIPFGTTIADFETALETLPTMGSVTVTSTGGTVCSSSGANVYITFDTRTGDLPLLEVVDHATLLKLTAPAVILVSSVFDGVHPLWGEFTLSFRGEVTGPIRHDANAAEIKVALESLDTIGAVTVTGGGYGVDVHGRSVQNIWTVRFDKLRYVVAGGDPTNVGPLPLLVTDDTGLVCATHSRQRRPTIHVNRILLGSTGNAREDNVDLNSINVLLTHTTRTNHRLGMSEEQTIECTASGGTFTLSFGQVGIGGGIQTTLPIEWDATAADVMAALRHTNNTLGEISVEYHSSQATACVPSNAMPMRFQMPASFGDADEIVADETKLISMYDNGGDAIRVVEIIKGGIEVVYTGGLTGKYDVKYVPEVKGHYDLKVTILGRDIETDLSNGVFVMAALTSGTHSTHTARPFAMEGVEETFVVQARDEFLNELDNSPSLTDSGIMSKFTSFLTGTPDYRSGQLASVGVTKEYDHSAGTLVSTKVPTTITSSTTPNTDGRFVVKYDPIVAGDYLLHVLWLSSGGLKATYYQNEDFSKPSPGTAPHCPRNSYTVVGSHPSLLTQKRREDGYAMSHCNFTRVDPTINFDWGEESPLGLLIYPKDQFSVVWEGSLHVPITGDYIFHLRGNDGFRLFLDGKLVLEEWGTATVERSMERQVQMINLEGNRLHEIRVEYLELYGEAKMSLSWSGPGITKQIIPSTHLYHSRHLDGSPMTVLIYPGEIDSTTTDASDHTNEIVGAGFIRGLSDAVAGWESQFTVQAKDTGGNNRYNDGSDVFEIKLTGISGWAQNGRTNAVWSGGIVPQDGTPITLTWSGGHGIEGGNNEIRNATVVPNGWIELCNGCVEIYQGSREMNLTRALGVGVLSRGDIVHLGDESFTVDNDTTKLFTERRIPLDSSSGRFEGQGMYLRSMRAPTSDCGSSTRFCVDCQVCEWSTRTVGYAPKESNLTLHRGARHELGEGTGTHTVSFTPYVRGQYRLDVQLKEVKAIQLVHVHVVVATGSSASSSSNALLGGTFMLRHGEGTQNTLSISAAATASQIQAALESLPTVPTGSVLVSDIASGHADNLGKSWHVTFTGFVGTQELLDFDATSLTGNGAGLTVSHVRTGSDVRPISGSPFTINVVPDRTNPSTSTALGEGLVAAVTGRESVFTIQAKDIHGNDRLDTQTRDVFSVDIFQPGEIPTYEWSSGEAIGSIPRRRFTATKDAIHVRGIVAYNGAGSYLVRYTPFVAGTYTIAINMQTKAEIQQIEVAFTGEKDRQGTYTLTAGCMNEPVARPCVSNTTSPIAWDASADDVKRALEMLETVEGSLSVVRTPDKETCEQNACYGYKYSITFIDAVGDLPMLVPAFQTTLFGPNAQVIATESQAGRRVHIRTAKTTTHHGSPAPLSHEIQILKTKFTGTGTTRSGTFTVSYNGHATPPVAWDATDVQMKAALESLSTIGSVFVTRQGPTEFGYEWRVTFLSWNEQDASSPGHVTFLRNVGNLPAMTIVDNSVLGDGVEVTVIANGATSPATGDASINGRSPFTLLVVPSAIEASNTTALDGEFGTCTGHCTAKGGGLSTGTSQSISSFTIQARDAWANAIPRGPIREIQVVTLTADGGTFSLISSEGQESQQVNYNEIEIVNIAAQTRHVLERELEKLDTFGSVSVERITPTSDNTTISYSLTYDTRLGDVPRIEINTTGLTRVGDQKPVGIVTYCDKYRVQRIETSASAGATIGGSWRLYYASGSTDAQQQQQLQATRDLAHDATEDDVRSAIETDLDLVFAATVTRTGPSSVGGYVWIVDLVAVEEERSELYSEGHLLYSHDSSVDGTITTATIMVDSWRGGEYDTYCPNLVQSGREGDAFVVALRGPASSRGDVAYLSNGQYKVTYVTPRSGVYDIDVGLARRGGLSAEYFNNRWLYGATSAMERIDPTIDFQWDTFITPTGVDYISVRWRGYIQPAYSETYTFALHVNDGAKLWIDGEVLIDGFNNTVADDHTPGYHVLTGTTTQQLSGDRLIPIVVEYRENTGPAVARLFWSSPSQMHSLVPSNRLFSSQEPIRGSPFSVNPVSIRPSPPLDLTVTTQTEIALNITWRAPANDGGSDVTRYKIEWWLETGHKEMQTIIQTGATGGIFTLSVYGEVTGELQWNSSPKRVELALEKLPMVGDVTVTCNGTTYTDGVYEESCLTGIWVVVFESNSGKQPTIVIEGSAMSAGTFVHVCSTTSGSTAQIDCNVWLSRAGTNYTSLCDTDIRSNHYADSAGASATDVGCGYVSGRGLDTVDVTTGVTSGSAFKYQYTINNLRSGVLYHVRVTALNDRGYGLPSITIDGTPMAVPNPPRSVTHHLVAGSSTQMKMYWEAPAITTTTDTWHQSNGRVVDMYKIEWDLNEHFNTTNYNSKEVAPTSVDSPKIALGYEDILNGLTKGTTVYVRISARNELGYGLPRSTVENSYLTGFSDRFYSVPRRCTDQLTFGEVGLAVVPADDTTSVYDSVQSLRVVWSPPVSDHGARTANYTIEWFSEKGRSEIQEILVQHTANDIDGTFVVSYGNSKTDILTHDVSADDMTLALEGLPSIRSAQVQRMAAPGAGSIFGYLWRVTFSGEIGPLPSSLEIDGTGLSSNVVASTSRGMDVTLTGTATATQGSPTLATTSDLTTELATYAFVQIGPHVRDVYEVLASDSTTITLARPYEGSTDATATLKTGFTVPGRLPNGYQSHVYVPEEGSFTTPYVYVIKSLTTGIPYYVTVSANNERGLSVAQVTVPTMLAPPMQKPSEPLNAELATHTSTSLRVYWYHPLSNGGDTITTYRIEWDLQDTFDQGLSGAVLGNHELVIDESTGDCIDRPCSFVIGSLSKGTRYFARVYAYNSYGYSVQAAYPRPLSEIPKTQPSPPSKVIVTAFDEKSLRVSFDASPDDGGAPVTKYLVEWDAADQEGYDASGTPASLLYAEEEIQVIKTSSDANDLIGTFRVGFETEFTYDLDCLVSAEEMKIALELLPTIGEVDVRRRENDPTYIGKGHEWIVTFRTNYGNVASMEISTDSSHLAFSTGVVSGGTLTGTNPSVSVTTTVEGMAGYEQQTVTITSAANNTKGTFALDFDGQATPPMPHNASAEHVRRELESLQPSTGKLFVFREIYQSYGHRWTIVYLERLGNQPTLTCDQSKLVGSSMLCICDELVAGILPAFDSGAKGSVLVLANGRSKFQQILSNLNRATRYHVRVSAWNGVGEVYGNTMYSTPATMSPSRVADRPPAVMASTINATAINITWDMPVDQGGQSCPITGYKVEWDGNEGAREIQQIVVTGGSSGTFTLSLGGQTSQELDHDVTGLGLKSALEAVSTIGQVDVNRDNSNSESIVWLVTFNQNIGNVDEMSADGRLLVARGGATIATVQVSTIMQGTEPNFDQGTKGIRVASLGSFLVTATSEIQTITTSSTADDMAGSFWVTYNGASSIPIRFDSTSFDVERALEGIRTLGDVTVNRRVEKCPPSISVGTCPYTPITTVPPIKYHGKSWDVTFSATEGNVASLLVSTCAPGQCTYPAGKIGVQASGTSSTLSYGLTGTSATVSVTEKRRGVSAPRNFVVVAPDLSQHSPLFLRVSSINAEGISAPRLGSFSVATKNQPPAESLSVTMSVISGSRVGVRWTTPDNTGGWPITKYTIQWTTNEQFTGQVLSAVVGGGDAGKEHSYTIDHLISGQDVFARVLAYNKLGYGPPSLARPQADHLHEIQTISVRSDTSPPIGATFTLSFDGQTTISMPIDVTAPLLQESLQSLNNIGTVHVKRFDLTDTFDTTGGAGTFTYGLDWSVTFTSNAGCVDSVAHKGSGIPTMTATTTLTDASTTTTTVLVKQEGKDSSQKYLTTTEQPPSGPTNVKLSIISKTALGVSWGLVAETGGSAPVDKYLVEWDETYRFRLQNTYTNSYTEVISAASFSAGATILRYKIGEAVNGHMLTSATPYHVRVSAHTTNGGWGPAVVADPVSREGKHLNFTAPNHDYQWDPRHQSPVEQIPYLPDSVVIDVSVTNIANQIDVRWTRPTTNILGFDYNAEIDFVDYYRLEFDPSNTFDSAVASDGPHGYYDLPIVTPGSCTNALGAYCEHALGREVQTIAVTWSGSSDPTAGSFALQFLHTNPGSGVDGVAADNSLNTTTCLGYDATATDVQTALRLLSSVGLTNKIVSIDVTRVEHPNQAPGSRGHSYRVTFVGFAVQGNVPSLVVTQPGQAPDAHQNVQCTAWSGGASFPLIEQKTLHEGGQLISGTNYFVRVRAIVSSASSQLLHPETGPSGIAHDTNGDGANDYTMPRDPLRHSNANGMGESKDAATLSEIPRCPPLKPLDVGGYALRGHAGSYHVVWTHPLTNNGADITQWKIEYSDLADTNYIGDGSNGFNAVVTHTFIASNDDKHGMAHHRPGTDYYWNIPSMPIGRMLRLRVYAYNDQGFGLPQEVEARCEDDVEDCTAENRARALPGLPGSVTVSSPSNDNEFTKNTLLVSWDMGVTGGISNDKYKVEWDTVPTFDTRQGKPLSYEFNNVLGTSPEVLESSNYLGRLEYNITGLEQGINIFVRVTSHNTLGYSMSGCLSTELGTVHCKPSVVTPSAVLAAKPMEPPGK